MSDPNGNPKRRDLLTTAAFALTGAGAAAALWPLIAALGPDAETKAKRRLFSLHDLDANGQATIDVDGQPVLIFRRTAEEIQSLAGVNTATTPVDWQQGRLRSIKPEIMVVIARCTREGCIVKRYLDWFDKPTNPVCVCCGSKYDLAGRRLEGPAPRDLDVPGYRYISPGEIEFEELQPI